MAAALRLARRGLGRTAPNPAVGCLIVQGLDGRDDIVGRGWTMPGGRPHAEAVALKEAGARAKGATAYVTLEPCAHKGRGDPCADALVQAGIARLVCAMTDPDPRTAGQGFEKLAAAGIAIVRDVLAAEARHLLRSHVLRAEQERPFVQLKLALSADGMIAGPGRAPVRITGETANGWVQRMRAQADAILVGAGTVRADDPLLTCRLSGAEDRSPVRIVLDAGLNTDPAARVIATAEEVPTWIFSASISSMGKAESLSAAGAEIIPGAASENRVDISAVLAALSARGITRLMVEGGADAAASFLAAGLVDEAWLFEGAADIGADGYPAFPGGREEALAGAGLALAERFALGQDRVFVYERPE